MKKVEDLLEKTELKEMANKPFDWQDAEQFLSEIVGNAYKYCSDKSVHYGRIIVPFDVREVDGYGWNIDVWAVDNEGIHRFTINPDSLRFLIESGKVVKVSMGDFADKASNVYVDFLDDCDWVCDDVTFKVEIKKLHAIERLKLTKLQEEIDGLKNGVNKKDNNPDNERVVSGWKTKHIKYYKKQQNNE